MLTAKTVLNLLEVVNSIDWAKIAINPPIIDIRVLNEDGSPKKIELNPQRVRLELDANNYCPRVEIECKEGSNC